MHVKAVVFDMDGVLLDSERVALEAWEEGLERYGYTLPREFWLTTIGLSSDQIRPLLTTRLGADFPYDEVKTNVGHSYGQRIIAAGPTMIREGILDLIEWLASNDIPCAVATSARRKWAEKCLAASNLLGYFRCICGGDEVGFRKPHPDVYLLAATRLGVPATECIALEDSETGLASARAAGAHLIFVPSILPAPAASAPPFVSIRAAMQHIIDLLAVAPQPEAMRAITGNYRYDALQHRGAGVSGSSGFCSLSRVALVHHRASVRSHSRKRWVRTARN